MLCTSLVINVANLHTEIITNEEANNLSNMYSFDTERRHQLKLPMTVANEGFGASNLAEAQFNEQLHGLLNSDARPFGSIESQKVVAPNGASITCAVLDVFDRPLYVLPNDDYTMVTLQAPVLKGFKKSEEAVVLSYLETYVPDLSFEIAPLRTLAASMVVSFEEFIAQTTLLLNGFSNRVREASLYVKENRADGLRDPLSMT